MTTKSIIFFSLISLSIILRISCADIIIPKYGKKTIYSSSDNVFLDVSDFDSGDKIYISITTYHTHYNTRLDYIFCNSANGPYLTNNFVYDSSSSSTYGEDTYNYKIKKDVSDAKYLYLSSSLPLPIDIENTEDDATTTIIIIVVVCFVVLVAAIVIIVCCCRRCRARRLAAMPVPYPSAIGVGVSPYGVQPVPIVQPVVQPVGIAQPYYNPAPQYNQVAPAPIGSDVRVNQNSNYEKPM